MPNVADASARVRADMSKFGPDLKAGSKKPLQSFGQRIKGALNPAALIGGGVALIGAAVVGGLVEAVGSLMRIERIGAQTDSVIRSTGGAANVTREQIDEMAGSLESLTGVEAESITEGQNLLLTFTKIRDEVGTGNDIFTQATEVLVDMSVAMGTDAATGAMQLGKALNDPVKGIAALSRVGITFTQDQEDMIRAMSEAGDMLGAQKIILAELETQFGGSAEAFGQTTSGKIARFMHEVGTFFETVVLGAAETATSVGQSMDLTAMHFGDMGDRSNALADRMGISFNDLKLQVRARMLETGESVDEAMSGIEARMDGGMAQVNNAVAENLGGTVQSFKAKAPEMQAAADSVLRDPLIIAMLGGKEEAMRIADETPGAIAQALLDNQFSVEDAAAELARVAEESLHPLIERAQIIGLLTSGDLERAIKYGEPAVAAAAEATRAAAEARLAQLDGYPYGQGFVSSLVLGITQSQWKAQSAAAGLAQVIKNVMPSSEPKDPNSPLRGITEAWGFGDVLAGGLLSGMGSVRGAAGLLAGAMVPSLDMNGMSQAMAGSAAGGAEGGGDMTININAPTTPMSERDIGRELRRTGVFGARQ